MSKAGKTDEADRSDATDSYSSAQTTILVHYYRAMVARADVWRTRMDTTTNWAIGSTAAILSFTLSDQHVPHYVVSIAPLMTTCFLLLEARRLTFYNLFQQRVLLLEAGLIRGAVGLSAERSGESADAGAARPLSASELSAALDSHLGRTRPTMPIIKATARRLRRVYAYVFGIQGLAWGFKLVSTPSPAQSFSDVAARANIGFLPGAIVLGCALLLSLSAVGIAVVCGGVDRTSS